MTRPNYSTPFPTPPPRRPAKVRPYVRKASDALKHFEKTAAKIEAAQTQQALELASAALWAAEAFTELLVRVKNANITAEEIPHEISFDTIKRLSAAGESIRKLQK